MSTLPDAGGAPANPYTELLHSYSDQHFYGRRAELRLLETAVRDPASLTYALVGGPKLGKTALLLRFCSEQSQADQPVLYIDCQQRSAEELLSQLVSGLAAGLAAAEEIAPGAADPLAGQPHSALLAAISQAVRAHARRGRRPVLCLDHLGRGADEQDALLPALLDLSSDASLVIAVEPDRLDLVQRHAPLADRLFVRRVGLLPFHEAVELMRSPVLPLQDAVSPWMDDELRGIFAIAGGHPYVLTLICEELFARRVRGSSVLSAQLMRRSERLIADLETLPQVRLQLNLAWQRISPAARAALGAAAQGDGQIPPHYADGPAAGELRDWGLIDTDDNCGELRVASALLLRFVRAQAPARPESPDLDELAAGLRGNEGELLRVLRANAGQVVSVEQLLQEVWGGASDRHLVDQTLSRLRKRLRQLSPHGDELIRGLRGQGYILDPPE